MTEIGCVGGKTEMYGGIPRIFEDQAEAKRSVSSLLTAEGGAHNARARRGPRLG